MSFTQSLTLSHTKISQIHDQGANLLFSANDSTYFIIWQGKRRQVPRSLLDRIFDVSKYTKRTQSQVDAFECGPSLDTNGSLVQINGKPQIYYINFGNRYRVNDPQAMTDFGFDWNKVKKINSSTQIGCFIDYGDLKK